MKAKKELMPHNQAALIYCRVSSTRQKVEGHGLESQEHRCRQYAALKGYAVAAVFPDDVSGGGDFMKRPGMVALLSYIDARPHENFVIVFDDLKRFARDRDFHFSLRRALSVRGAKPECLNYQFDDSPEGEFVETIFAAQGQLEREQNRRQVIQKMTAVVEGDRYIFSPPIGYEYAMVEGVSTLVPNEPIASVVRECLEGFASGRFESMSEVKRHMETFPCIPKNPKGKVYINTVREMLKRPTNAGLIRVKTWGPELMQGGHEPLISVETWHRLQERLDGKAYAPARKDLNADFPLRGYLQCATCGDIMTAAWATGRSARYAYYWCKKKECALHRRSIRKEKVEGAFETLLQSLTPAPQLHGLARAMFEELWAQRQSSANARADSAKKELARLSSETSRVADRLIAANSPAAIRAYESRLEQLENEKAAMSEKAQETSRSQYTFDDVFRTAIAFLSNPLKLWASGQFAHKRMLLKLAFPGRLEYCPIEGFRTAEIALPFRLLGPSGDPKLRMVELDEPTSNPKGFARAIARPQL